MGHSPALSVACGCNTDAAYPSCLIGFIFLFLKYGRYIASGINALATVHYVTDYITKGNLAFQNLLTVCGGAVGRYADRQMEARVCRTRGGGVGWDCWEGGGGMVWYSTVTYAEQVADSDVDRGRRTIIKCVNAIHADVEVPATLAATHMLDLPDHYTSHSYTSISIRLFTSAYEVEQRRGAGSEGGGEDGAEDTVTYSIEKGNDGLTLVNQCIT